MAESGTANRMEKLEPVGNGSMELGHQLDELIAYKRETLKSVQQAVLIEQATLVNTKQEIERLQREAKYAQEVERDRFRAELRAEKEAVQAERKVLEQLDLELHGRRKEVEVLEAQALPTRQALQKLQDERIAVEQQRLRNEELKSENDRLANEAATLHEEASQLKAATLKQQTRLSLQAVEQEQIQKRLEQQQKDVTLQLDNLAALKGVIDPKLAEVQRLQTQAEADRVQATILHDATAKQQAELAKQRADLATLSSQLQAKADALTEYDAALKRTEAELRIKLQQAAMESHVTVALPTRAPDTATVPPAPVPSETVEKT